MTHHSTMMQKVALGLVAAAAFAATACDLSVTNPGPVADGALDSASARRAIVTGARRALGEVLNASAPRDYGLAYRTAAVTYEINPAGSTGSFGVPTYIQYGTFHADDNNWDDAQRARWIAEDGIRRIREGAKGDSALVTAGVILKNRFPEDSLLTVLTLWAGYANRLLGENFCDCVINGGSKLDFKAFFARADSAFTEALRMATALPSGTATQAATRTALMNASRAGRASVRMYMAYYNYNGVTWAQATADANAVPSAFVWSMPFYDQDQNQYNAVYWARGNGPYRAHTQWATYYENYYRATRDPRVPWDTTTALPAGTPATGDAAVQKFAGYPGVTSSNRVPFWPERKFNSRTAATNLSSGWEMRLIEAEAALVNNDTTTALAIINARRAALAPVQGAVNAGGTIGGGWTQLKRERMLELWLEARRLGDLRRWRTSGTPGYNQGTTFDGVWVTGEVNPRETMTSPTVRNVCIPIGLNETQTNPNLLVP